MGKVLGPGGVGFLENIKKVVSHKEKVIALTNDGLLFGWGFNHWAGVGSLGTGSEESYVLYPEPVLDPTGMAPIENIVDLWGGQNVMFAKNADGHIYGWGVNIEGLIGDGTTEDRDYPTQVKGIDGVGYLDNVVEISSGMGTTFALLSDGTVCSWGVNDYGALGYLYPDIDYSPVPRVVTGFSPLDKGQNVGVGQGRAIVMAEDGHLYTWGLNNYYEVNLGTGYEDQFNPNPAPVLFTYNAIDVERKNVWVKKAGTYQPVKDLQVKKNGQYNPVTGVWVKKSGIWKPVR